MTPDYTLAGRLRGGVAARLEQGHTLSDVASQSGVPQPVLHRFFRSGKGLRLATAERLLHALGLRVV